MSAKISTVNDLASYYEELAIWENKQPITLIAVWDPDDVAAISCDFQTAFLQANFHCMPLIVAANTSNQSVGNKVADFLTGKINPHFKLFRVEGCSGAGCPDKRLVRVADSRAFVFELKATS